MRIDKPIRVLQAVVANDRGGLTGYVCQNYRFVDRNKVQFDFITYDDVLDFEEEFKNMGAKFYRFPRASHIFEYYKTFKAVQEEMHYDVVHFHMSYANVIPLIIANLVGIKRVIIHSHSTQIDSKNTLVRKLKELFNRCFKIILPIVAVDYCACSTEAANWMYPTSILNNRKYKLCRNAIDSEKFKFNINVRKIKREELGIKDKEFVVGHIGRFTYVKNHEFIINIFEQLSGINNNVKLLLIGDGPLKETIERNIDNKCLNDKVLFLGHRDDVPQLMQAMDCFILPSKFEGLPIVGIETQAAGLPSLFSNKITREVGITKLAKFLKDDGLTEWVEEILNCLEVNRDDTSEAIIYAGYEIKNEILNLENIYLNERKSLCCTPPRD